MTDPVTLGQIAPEVQKEIYADLAKPTCKEVGRFLGRIAGSGNWLLDKSAEAAAAAKKYVTENLPGKISHIPDMRFQEPPLPLIAKINDKIIFSEDELKDMFLNLLAKSMDKETTSDADPSFVNIIDDLSPLDAALLKAISRNPLGTTRIAAVRVVTQTPGVDGYRTAAEHIIPPDTFKITDYNKYAFSISKLAYLGLITLPEYLTISLTDKSRYEGIKSSDIIKTITQHHEGRGEKVLIREGIIEITELGITFINTCVLHEPVPSSQSAA